MTRRGSLWTLFLAASLGIHLWISGGVGGQLGTSEDGMEIRKTKVLLRQEERSLHFPVVQEENEPLRFDDQFELKPPEVLLTPVAIVPPKVEIPPAFKAASGGVSEAIVEGLPAIQALGSGGGASAFGTGIGNGLGGSSEQFSAYVKRLRESGLDVVFVVDATGSMAWVIEEVRSRIYDIVDTVRSLVPISRFGIVAYRDFDDPEFLTKVQGLTYSTSKLHRFAGTLEAKGGGSLHEAISEGLTAAIKHSSWRTTAKRLVILIGDAPPYQEHVGTIENMVRGFAQRGGQISALDVSYQANSELAAVTTGRPVNPVFYRNEPMYEFQLIAEAGRGDAATLDGDIRLTKRLITLILGDRFAAEMGAFLEMI